MTNYSIIDPNFDINITTSYFLSIQLFLDGFSFCVLDPVSNEYIQFQSKKLTLNGNILETLQDELVNNDLLLYPYQKVFVIYYTTEYTIIPNPLYQKEEEKNYLDFCFSNKTSIDSLVYSNKIKMADSVCLYRIPKSIVNLLCKYYNHIQFFCQTIPFIESALLSTTMDPNHNHVHINLQPSNFDIIVTSGNNLKMHNSFNYHSQKDFLYYTLLTFEQLKLDIHSTNIFLSGKIDKSNDLYFMLKKYIKQVEIKKETKHFKFASVFKNTPIQDHLNLFNIPLCV